MAGILEEGPIRRMLKERRMLKQSPDMESLSWLKSKLEEAVRDEELADANYSIIADQLSKHGYAGFSSGVILIANDERRHKATLENILRGLK